MTKTTQPCSWTTLIDEEKGLTIDQPETETNASLLLKVCTNLNELYEMLGRLSYVMGKTIAEFESQQKSKGEREIKNED